MNFKVSDELAEKIEATTGTWGFTTKSEFFRYITLQFVENNHGKLPDFNEVKRLSAQILQLKERRDVMAPYRPGRRVY